MDNYEYNIKSDQIKKLYNKHDYSTAAKVADSIDWRRVKNNSMLNLVADIYDRCKEYEKARDVLLIAYNRTARGRQMAYKLTILSLRLKDFVEADEFYRDFVEIAPEDTTRYILKYRIAKTKGEDSDVLIQILEAYAEVEMDERWQYELAKLYDETGRKDKCVAMCDQIILWFSEGKYVEKAMELKMKHEPLTEEQKQKYDNRRFWKESKIEDAPPAVPVEETTAQKVPHYDTKTDILNDTFGNIPLVREEQKRKEEPASPKSGRQAEEEKEQEGEKNSYREDLKNLDREMYGNRNTIEFYDFTDTGKDKMSKIDEDIMKTAEIDIDEINFRAMNVSEYDTASIQAAIAKSMEIIMNESKPQEVHGESSTEPENEEKKEAGTTKRINTREISANVRSPFENSSEEQQQEEALRSEAKLQVMKEHLEMEKEENLEERKSIYNTVPLSPLFEQEEDGQIGIAEPKKEETQIEGQMTIEEVLHEYEIRAKYEAALAEVAKYEAEIKKQEERRKAREAAVIIEMPPEVKKPEPEEEEDALSDDNDELVQVEESGESDWMENPGDAAAESAVTMEESPFAGETAAGEETALEEEKEALPEEETEAGELPQEETEAGELPQEETEAGELPQEEAEAGKLPQEEAEAEELPQEETEPEELPQEEAEAETAPPEKVVVQNRDAEEIGHLRLKDEYRAVFADFLDVAGLEEQLVTTIDHLINDFEMDGTSKSNNVLVMGDAKVGKTTLALGIIKVANRGRGHGRSSRKVAKIKAEVLNKKGVTMAMPKILGTDLIIEKAGNLTSVAVADLIEIMKTYTEEMLIVMEDDQAAIERLISVNPEMEKVFNNKIYIKGYDPDDYVRMAKDYAAKRRYIVSEMGTLALYARIGDIFGRNQCVTKEELEEIIDEAIQNSERGGIKKLLGKMKRNKEEFQVLKEEDFV